MIQKVLNKCGDSFYCWPVWVRGVFIGSLTSLVGLSQDYIAHRLGYPWFAERIAANIIVGTILGFVAYWFNRLRERRLALRNKEIGFLNHNVRNALQVIHYSHLIEDVDQRNRMVAESVQRVSAVLGRLATGDFDTPIPTKEQKNAANNGGV